MPPIPDTTDVPTLIRFFKQDKPEWSHKQCVAVAMSVARRNGASEEETSMDKKASFEAPQTGPEAILYALQNIDLDEVEKSAKETLKTGKRTKRSGAVQQLQIVQGMRRNNQTPSDYMISAVPVIPPQFRPFAAAGGTFIPGDANVLYKDFFDIKTAHDEERKMFGDEYAGKSRLDMYDGVRSLYGYGEPVKAKTKAKEVKGFLQAITGSTSKFGYVQRRLLSKTQDNTGRSTIIVDPELGIDEIGIPVDLAFTMYAPYIQRRLKQSGMKDAEALKNVKDRTPEALRALEKEMEVRPVFQSRAPSWHKHSLVGAKPKLIEGNALAVNPYVAAGQGADYDGDQVNVHVPSSDVAVKEVYERMMPSMTPFSDRVPDKIVPLPKQEQVLGLFTAATAPQTQPVIFNTEEEAMHAIRTGKVGLDQDIEILNQPTQ